MTRGRRAGAGPGGVGARPPAAAGASALSGQATGLCLCREGGPASDPPAAPASAEDPGWAGSSCSFPWRAGGDSVSKTLPGSKFDLCPRNGDSPVRGWRGGSRPFLPQGLGTGWGLTFPTTWLLAAAPSLSSTAWAAARHSKGPEPSRMPRAPVPGLPPGQGAAGAARGSWISQSPCSPLFAPEPAGWQRRPHCLEVGEWGLRAL